MTRIQYVIVVARTEEPICVEDTLHAALQTVTTVEGLDIRIQITHTEVMIINK